MPDRAPRPASRPLGSGLDNSEAEERTLEIACEVEENHTLRRRCEASLFRSLNMIPGGRSFVRQSATAWLLASPDKVHDQLDCRAKIVRLGAAAALAWLERMIAVTDPFYLYFTRQPVSRNFLTTSETVAFALHNQRWSCQCLQMLDARLGRISWRMERVAQAYQPAHRRFIRDHAGDSTAHRLSSNHETVRAPQLANRVPPRLE